MPVNFNNFTNYAVSFFRSNVLPSFTSRQNKIFLVASIALGFLATAYVMKWGCFKAKVVKDIPPVDQKSGFFPAQYLLEQNLKDRLKDIPPVDQKSGYFPEQHLLEQNLKEHLKKSLSSCRLFNEPDLYFELAKEFGGKKYSEVNFYQNVEVLLKKWLSNKYDKLVEWDPITGKKFTDFVCNSLKECLENRES
jgi:hypothetical protein